MNTLFYALKGKTSFSSHFYHIASGKTASIKKTTVKKAYGKIASGNSRSNQSVNNNNYINIIVRTFLKDLLNNNFNLNKSAFKGYQGIVNFLRKFEVESGVTLKNKFNPDYISKIKTRGISKRVKRDITINVDIVKFLNYVKNTFQNFNEKDFLSINFNIKYENSSSKKDTFNLIPNKDLNVEIKGGNKFNNINNFNNNEGLKSNNNDGVESNNKKEKVNLQKDSFITSIKLLLFIINQKNLFFSEIILSNYAFKEGLYSYIVKRLIKSSINLFKTLFLLIVLVIIWFFILKNCGVCYTNNELDLFSINGINSLNSYTIQETLTLPNKAFSIPDLFYN